MIYDFVPFHEVAEEIARNLEAHYNDVDIKDEYGRPNLDWDNYLMQSKNGTCRTVTARDNGKLVGYSTFCIGLNMNHKTNIEAANTGIFIDKEYRGKITNEFLKKADEYLKELGVHEINYILLDDRIGLLLRRAKYEPRHTVWSKKLCCNSYQP